MTGRPKVSQTLLFRIHGEGQYGPLCTQEGPYVRKSSSLTEHTALREDPMKLREKKGSHLQLVSKKILRESGIL